MFVHFAQRYLLLIILVTISVQFVFGERNKTKDRLILTLQPLPLIRPENTFPLPKNSTVGNIQEVLPSRAKIAADTKTFYGNILETYNTGYKQSSLPQPICCHSSNSDRFFNSLQALVLSVSVSLMVNAVQRVINNLHILGPVFGGFVKHRCDREEDLDAVFSRNLNFSYIT